MRKSIQFTLVLLLALFTAQVFSQTIRSRSVGNSFWDHSLSVESRESKFGDEFHHGYTITVYDASEKDVAKYWKDYLKSKGAKVKSKNGVQGEGAIFTKIHDQPIEVRSSFEPGADNSVHLNVAFLKDGEPFNPDGHPEAHDQIMALMQEMSVEMNQAVIAHQIETHEETLSDRQKDLVQLQKDNEKLRETISKNKKNIEKARQTISDAQADLAGANSRLEVYTVKEEPTADDMKTMDKIRKEINKLNEKVAKNEQNITRFEAEIQKAEAAIPHNEEEQERMKVSIQEQAEVVEQWRAKKESVN